MRIHTSEPGQAARQASWIAVLEPWRSLGYRALTLGRFLGERAAAGHVLVAEDEIGVQGILAYQPDVLLGYFIALLAVRPQAAGRGLGRALVARVEKTAFRRRRWLYVSCDSANRAATRFYRKLGFERAARLAGLIRDGRTEILWRKRRPERGSS